MTPRREQVVRPIASISPRVSRIYIYVRGGNAETTAILFKPALVEDEFEQDGGGLAVAKSLLSALLGFRNGDKSVAAAFPPRTKCVGPVTPDLP